VHRCKQQPLIHCPIVRKPCEQLLYQEIKVVTLTINAMPIFRIKLYSFSGEINKINAKLGKVEN